MGRIPVGVVGYLDSVARSENHSSSSTSSSSSRSTAGNERPCGAVSEAPPHQMHESRALGISINATQCEHAHLAGAGSLLPAWRQVAEILAPLCHQVLPTFLCCYYKAFIAPDVVAQKHWQNDLFCYLMLQKGLQSGLRIALLLHGPSGCGKTTAVRAAAAALGLHVIPFSCHEFNGQADTVAANAVRAAFRSALNFSPAVLLLQDFAALSDAASGAPSGQQSHVSPTPILLIVHLPKASNIMWRHWCRRHAGCSLKASQCTVRVHRGVLHAVGYPCAESAANGHGGEGGFGGLCQHC